MYCEMYRDIVCLRHSRNSARFRGFGPRLSPADFSVVVFVSNQYPTSEYSIPYAVMDNCLASSVSIFIGSFEIDVCMFSRYRTDRSYICA